MKRIYTSFNSTLYINIFLIVTLFLPLKFMLCCLGLQEYSIILYACKPCLLKILIYFSLSRNLPNKSTLFYLFISSLLVSLLLGTLFTEIYGLYISITSYSNPMFMTDNTNSRNIMSISSVLAETPFNHRE